MTDVNDSLPTLHFVSALSAGIVMILHSVFTKNNDSYHFSNSNMFVLHVKYLVCRVDHISLSVSSCLLLIVSWQHDYMY